MAKSSKPKKKKKSQARLKAQSEYQKALKAVRQRERRLKKKGLVVSTVYTPQNIKNLSTAQIKRETKTLKGLTVEEILNRSQKGQYKQYEKQKEQQRKEAAKKAAQTRKQGKPKDISYFEEVDDRDLIDYDDIEKDEAEDYILDEEEIAIEKCMNALQDLYNLEETREYQSDNKDNLIQIFQDEMQSDPIGLADRLENSRGEWNKVVEKALYAYYSAKVDYRPTYFQPFFRIVTGRYASMNTLEYYGISFY